MKIFKENYQPQVSEKYKINFSEFSIQEVKVPDLNEYIGTIYLFVNNINNKVYVGQTMTKFYSRFTAHFGDTHTKQDKLPFHSAIRKYGWDNFSKYIIWQSEIFERNENNKKILKDILNDKEVEFVRQYNSNNPEFGYNATDGGYYIPKNLNTKDSIEKAIKTRNDNKSNYMLGRIYEKHHLAVPILQYSTDKTFIKEWSCIKLAEDSLNVSIYPKNITSGGYFWCYKTNNVQKVLEDKYNRLKLLPKDCGKSKIVYCFDLFGEFVESFDSCGIAAKFIGCNQSEISHAALNKENGNVVHNYVWIYEEDLENKDTIVQSIVSRSRKFTSEYRPIYQIFLNGDVIKLWNSFKEIRESEEFSIGKNSINKCLNGKLNVYSNCFWVYEDEYSDDLLWDKLQKYRKTKKTLVDDILSGKITYQDSQNLKKELDTTNNKQYLKEHPTVYQFDKNYKLIKKWENYKDIEIQTQYRFANISKCLRRKMNTAYDFIWRFEEDVLNNNLV